MTVHSLGLTLRHRLGWLLALGLALLAGCGGGGSKVNEFIPTRIVVIGDSYSFLGTGADRITVNDGTVNNWALQVAASYGLPSSSVVSYAAADASTSAIASQLSGHSLTSGDLLLISGGLKDIYTQADLVTANTINLTTAQATITTAAHTFRDFIKGLPGTGGMNHILFINVPNIKNGTYGTANPSVDALTQTFNLEVKSNFGTQPAGAGVRLYDAELLFNGTNATLTPNGITNITAAFCDGSTGTRATNLTNCTDTGSASYLFANDKYITPVAHRLLGQQVYLFMRSNAGW